MLQNSYNLLKHSVSWALGGMEEVEGMLHGTAYEPFSVQVMDFLAKVSKNIMKDREAKTYPEVITLGFWIRKSSLESLKKRFLCNCGTNDDMGKTWDGNGYRLGRGTVFHIAPSNVPVNFAYSLVMGLLCGNANIVRLPSKDFPQIGIIIRALKLALNDMPEFKPYIVLVRYNHEKEINDIFSGIADVRVIWGGDATVEEIRRSPLRPRASDITFADRYSLMVIDSDVYIEKYDVKKTASDFYNDTYLTDQNACTSPQLVVWMGNHIPDAKEVFWKELHNIVKHSYEIQGVQAVNKLTGMYLLAADMGVDASIKKINTEDNLIVRVQVSGLYKELMDYRVNSGYFFEYDCDNIMELRDICDDDRCQTVSYIGDKDMLLPLIKSRVRGIDRIVRTGKTMDFDLIWDGYNLVERLTRIVSF